MLGFVGRWLSDAIRLALSLLFAIAAMQVPALTHEYAVAALQVADGLRRDIDQREASARQFYHVTGETDEAVIAALRPVEPSNAATLSGSVERAQVLRATYDRINATPPLEQPVTAVLDLLNDPKGYKSPVLRTTLDSYAPEVVISASSTLYGLAGLAFGSLIGEIVTSLLGRSVGVRGNGSTRAA